MEINNAKKIKLTKSQLNLTNLLPVSMSNNVGNVVVLVGDVDITEKINKSNTTYCICRKYDLKDKILNVPKGSTLEFKGGSISNATIVGNDSLIVADYKVFSNVKVEGSWKCVGNVGWWANGSTATTWKGATVPGNNKEHDAIQDALDSSFKELIFPPKLYYTEDTLVLRKEKKLTLQGGPMANGLGMNSDMMINTAVIYTDKDIDLLVINVTTNNDNPSEVVIEGGNFDVSRIVDYDTMTAGHPYTHSCIKVLADDYNARLWGLTINTNIFGASSKTGIGIDLNPTKAITKANYNLQDYGYVTQIKIGGVIEKFGTGIKAVCHYANFGGKSECINWCSGLDTEAGILYCKRAVDIDNVDADIKGLIQADHIESWGNRSALIYVKSAFSTAIGAKIFDIHNTSQDTARYAVDITMNGGAVQAYGHFAALCHGVSDSLCTGYTNRFYI